jgi:hypothetical protein
MMADRSSPADPRLWADSIVNQLFSVGLELHVARRDVAGMGRERLTNALNDLDVTIRGIHLMRLSQHETAVPDGKKRSSRRPDGGG